jgi:hypothetical protein
MSFRHTSMAGQDLDASRTPQCPTCGAAKARALWYVPGVVYLHCHCGAAWAIRDRRKVRREPDEPVDRFQREPETE